MYSISYLPSMVATSQSTTNQQKQEQLERLLRAMLAEALCRGFFGSIAVELCIQDGTIQNIRQRMERIER